MHRTGSDPQNMEPTDFLCDFCEHPWSESNPFIEGHHGSCLCSQCLVGAIGAMLAGSNTMSGPCTMCLEERTDLRWRSSRRDAAICDRCIDQAKRVLSKDRSVGWSPPVT